MPHPPRIPRVTRSNYGMLSMFEPDLAGLLSCSIIALRWRLLKCYRMGYDGDEESRPSKTITEVEKKLRILRSNERTQNLDKMKELIDEALKKSSSKNRPVNEKMKWMSLAGRLIVFKDQILKNQENDFHMLELMEITEIINELKRARRSDTRPRKDD